MLGIGAVNTGNNLIYIIVSAFLSFMALSGFFGKRNISNLDLYIEFPDEVFASKETMLKVTLINKKRFFPAFLIKIRIRDKHILYPFVGPKNALLRYLKFIFPSRGIHQINDIYICSVFPFNFFMRCKRLDLNKISVVVFPEPKEYNHLEQNFTGQRKKGEEQSEERGYEGDLLSLRDYIPGDPLKYIHWKASAKTGQLKTKELSSLKTTPVLIDIERLRGRSVEEKLSFATFLVLRYSKMGLPFIVKIKGSVFSVSKTGGIKSSTKREILRELALY